MRDILKPVVTQYLQVRLKEVRTQKGLTQEKMAELMDISTRGYKNLEKGDYMPAIVTLILFLALTEDPTQELMDLLALVDNALVAAGYDPFGSPSYRI